MHEAEEERKEQHVCQSSGKRMKKSMGNKLHEVDK